MATKDQVISLHRMHPQLNSVQIAERLDCEDAYVRATFYRNGLKLARRTSAREKFELGDLCVKLGLAEADLYRLAESKKACA